MVRDLTKGNAGKVLLMFALPMFIGNVFQQLYNLVDFIVVGQVVGKLGLAAIGASFAIFFLMIAVGAGMSIGISVVVSQLFGARKIGKVKAAITTALILSAAAGVLLTGIGILISRPLLQLLDTPASFIDMSDSYLKIVFGGSLFVMMYNGITAVYNALGDSKTPLYILMATTVVNVGLDLLFVMVLQMSVGGAALATIISQGISAAILMILLKFKMRMLKSEDEAEKSQIFDKEIASKMIRIGVPSILQQSIVSIGMMFSQNIINKCGDDFIAGVTAGFRLDSFATMPFVNISTAMSSFTGQNIGAELPDRVRRGFRAGILTSSAIAVSVCGVLYLFGEPLLGVFLEGDTSRAAIDFGVEMLRWVSPFYVLAGIMFVVNGLLRGVGDIRSFLLCTISGLVGRIGSQYLMYFVILPPELKHLSVSLAIPIGWSISVLIGLIRYFSKKWENKRIVGIS